MGSNAATKVENLARFSTLVAALEPMLSPLQRCQRWITFGLWI